MKKFFVAFLFVLFVSNIFAVSVTIYNNNLALIKDKQDVKLIKGLQKVEIDNVATNIDPTSVLPKFSNNNDKIKINEQNFDYDLVNTNKLLQQYIGKEIEITKESTNSKKEIIFGTLLAVNGGMVVQSKDKIILNPSGEVSLPNLPKGLRLKPTLSWVINSQVEGNNSLEFTYQTSGISWVSDYIVVLASNDSSLDMNGWVTINNMSGATYENAKLKLVAGDINLVREQPRRLYAKNVVMATAEGAMVDEDFAEKTLFEYHMYDLSRKTTIKNNEKKQIQLITAQKIPVKKKYIYNSYKDISKVFAFLYFKNDKKSNLGLALPKGKVRVYKNDGNALEFVGEDKIDHTPENKDIELNLGKVFDVTVKRTQTDYRKISSSGHQETNVIELTNSKKEDIEVEVEENLGLDWKVIDMSDDYSKKNSQVIVFKVKVPANKTYKVSYTVKYSK